MGRHCCRFFLVLFIAAMAIPAVGQTPKRGGILTFMIPADAPPSFDGHRETTFATVHSVAPFYSVLIRVNPDNPSPRNALWRRWSRGGHRSSAAHLPGS